MVNDYYAQDYGGLGEDGAPVVDPVGPGPDPWRSRRGGSLTNLWLDIRIASRHWTPSGDRAHRLGFRPVRVFDLCDGRPEHARLADRQDGVCEGARKVCSVSAGWGEPDYAAVDGYEADEVSCDGADNDCDGETDEGCN